MNQNDNDESQDQPARIAELGPPEYPTPFEDWYAVISYNFPELVFAAEVGVATVAQLLINDVSNPFAFVLVDVPSAGKTIAINFFADIPGLTYATDKFTPASFVSNAANVSKDKLKDVDLLPRIRYKMLLIRDLATLFAKRDEDLTDVLGTLTRILDGEGFSTDSGIHGQREYSGDYLFMLMAASTPIPPKVWKVMGNLGPRLLFVNINSGDKTEEQLANQLRSTAYKDKELLCRNTTADLIRTLWQRYPKGVEWDRSKDDLGLLITISRCAGLLAKLRAPINVWATEDGVEHTVPVIEKPDRLTQVLYNAARGHALACGRTQIAEDDLRVVVEIVIDSAPSIRARLFRALVDHDGVMKTHEVEATLNCSKPTALKEMEKLRLLGVCHLRQDSEGYIGEPEKSLHLRRKNEA